MNNYEASHNFDEDSVITPIQGKEFAHKHLFGTPHKPSFSRVHFGLYEKFKLSSFLFEDKEDSTDKSDTFPSTGELIKILEVDPDPSQLYAQLTSDFDDLLIQYAAHDICFVGVTGPKECGKSFFCDKILNLAEIKGNNYSSSAKQPGLFCWSVPFVKGNLCIFLVEITGCEIGSVLYKVLHSLGLLIFSSVIYIHSNHQNQEQESFAKYQDELMDIVDEIMDFSSCQEDETETKCAPNFLKFFPQHIFRLTRKNYNEGSRDLKLSPFFTFQVKKFLPDARSPTFFGSDEDLKSFSFMASSCISPGYINSVHSIFKTVHHFAQVKKYQALPITGRTAEKVMTAATKQLNKGQKINVYRNYEMVLRELYNSSFNYSVMNFHSELEKYFGDQKPKNTKEMFQTFSKAEFQCFQNLNQFKLDRELHIEYENKLQSHIETKEKMLISINKYKTIQVLQDHFNQRVDIKMPSQSIVKLFKSEAPDLDSGREEVISDFLNRILQDIEYSRIHEEKEHERLQFIRQELKAKRRKLQILMRKKEIEEERKIKRKREFDEIKRSQFQKQRIRDEKMELVRKKVKKEEKKKEEGEEQKREKSDNKTIKGNLVREQIKKLKSKYESKLQELRGVVSGEEMGKQKMTEAEKKEKIDNLREENKRIVSLINKEKTSLIQKP